jgi:hypothetical protein
MELLSTEGVELANHSLLLLDLFSLFTNISSIDLLFGFIPAAEIADIFDDLLLNFPKFLLLINEETLTVLLSLSIGNLKPSAEEIIDPNLGTVRYLCPLNAVIISLDFIGGVLNISLHDFLFCS